MLAVPAAAEGKTAQCPECGHQLLIQANREVESPTSTLGQSAMGNKKRQSQLRVSPHEMTSNPYAPVGGTLEEVAVTPDDVESVRRYYLSHEVEREIAWAAVLSERLGHDADGNQVARATDRTSSWAATQLDVHFFLAAQ